MYIGGKLLGGQPNNPNQPKRRVKMAYIPNMPSKGYVINCTDCKKNFPLNKSNLKCKRITTEEAMKQQLTFAPNDSLYKLHYFCSECGKEYIIGYIDGLLKNKLGPNIKKAVLRGNKKLSKSLRLAYKKRMDKINNRS